jgi:hypothetical protein
MTKREVILQTWNEGGSESAGAPELKNIQQSIKKKFGTLESPASIARVLADEGIKLRHPEVLEFDSAWRERRLYELFGPGELEFETIEPAIESITRIDDLHLLFQSEGDDEGIKGVVELVRELKADLATRQNNVAREVSQWLTVWLQNPQIFGDWLSLRRNSPEFLKEFGASEGLKP